jgi:hypothetical protein
LDLLNVKDEKELEERLKNKVYKGGEEEEEDDSKVP